MNKTSSERGPSHDDFIIEALRAKNAAQDRDIETGDTSMSRHYYQAGPGGREFVSDSFSGNSVSFGGNEYHRGSISSQFRTQKSDNGIRTSYEATAIPPQGQEPSSGYTEILRFDGDGRVVYSHKSRNPRMARQAGIVTAKSVVRNIERDRAESGLSHEIPDIPDSAGQMVANIDKAKAEKPDPEVINDLRLLARKLTRDKPKYADAFLGTNVRAGFYKLVDGREAQVARDLSPYPGVADILITTIDHLDKSAGKLVGARKTYFITDKNVATSVRDFTQEDQGKPFQEFDSDLDELNDKTKGMTPEEAELAYDEVSARRDLELEMLETTAHQTSNEELINLMRLLNTSEELVLQEA